jgi:hypothetical protein
MAGDATNAALWQNADVYIAAANATAPSNVTSAWANAWSAVGLLDGEAGFAESREEESNEIYAWGGVLVKKTKSKHKRTIKFVALENNATVFGLVNPGSTRTTASGVTTSSIKTPTLSEFAIGFEMAQQQSAAQSSALSLKKSARQLSPNQVSQCMKSP